MENYQKYFKASKYMESHLTLWDELAHKITNVMRKFEIKFAIIGSIAGSKYGLHKTTDDIDILINKNDKKKVRGKLANIATEDQIGIDLINSDDTSGDGLTGDPNKKNDPQGLPFRDPDEISNLIDGVPYMTLFNLIQYKISSGMYGKNREDDFKHVRILIRANSLSENYGDTFRADIAETYKKLWNECQHEEFNGDRIK